MCEVPPRKVEGNWRERQGMKKAQAGRAGAGGSGEGSSRLPAHTHGALSHLSALRDSWEEHEAQHVPSRIGAGRRGRWRVAFGTSSSLLMGSPNQKKTRLSGHQLKALLGFRHPDLAYCSWSPRLRARQTYNFIPRHRDFRCQAWPSSGSDRGPSSLLSELQVGTSAKWP